MSGDGSTIDIGAIVKGLVDLAMNTVSYREALVANGLPATEATTLAIAFQQQMMQLMAIKLPQPVTISGKALGGGNEA